MEITKDIKRTAKVKEIRRDGSRWYYVVDIDGVEYDIKMYDYQKPLPQPDSITCIISNDPFFDGRKKVKQDLVPIIAAQYKVGEVYTFKVRKSRTGLGLNAVSDEGFEFILENPKKKRYEERQSIECKILSINGTKVITTEVEKKTSAVLSTNSFISPATIAQVVAGANVPPEMQRWFVRLFEYSSEFGRARQLLEIEAQEWLPEALKVIEEKMPHWVSRKALAHVKKVDLLVEFERLCVEVVERSNIFGDDVDNADMFRTRMAGVIDVTNECLSALRKINDGTIYSYAQDIITSLGRTGYIYEPQRRLHVLMRAMTIEPALLNKYIEPMLNTLSMGKKSNWDREPLRSAIVWFLSNLTELYASKADNVMDIKLGVNRQTIDNMVKAIGMTLLMDTENVNNHHVLLARLCRYTSLTDDRLSYLIEKAYAYLFGNLPKSLPFSWNEIRQSSHVLGYLLNQAPMPSVTQEPLWHEGPAGRIQVVNRTVSLYPLERNVKFHNALPTDMTCWRKMKVFTMGHEFDKPTKANVEDLTTLKRMWRSAEDTLLDGEVDDKQPQGSARGKKMLATVGDDVLIRITYREAENDEKGNPRFHCVIVSDTTMGEGAISPCNIVRYYSYYTQVEDFRDEKGRPLLLHARVTGELPNGQLTFDLLEFAISKVNDNLSVGDEVLCIMTISTPYHDRLLITETGYSLKIPARDNCPDLKKYDLAWVEITKIYPDGNIDGTFLEQADPDEHLTDRECLRNLLVSISEGVYEDKENDEDEEGESDEDDDQEQNLESSEADELIKLFDRQSVVSVKRADAFNLLGMARLMALVEGNNQKADEYLERMTFLQLMQQYETNQVIEAEEVESHYRRYNELIKDNSDFQEQIIRLFCISKLSDREALEELNDLAKQYANSLTGDVARLAVAHNLIIGDPELNEARKMLRNKINNLIGVTIRDDTDRQSLGEESATVEFKTSMVIPPDNNMRVDRERQTNKLLQVVCGMMNNQGGRLYVGVNDFGIAQGLTADFTEFAGSERYDEQKCRDTMDRYFLTNIRQHISEEASVSVKSSFMEHEGRSVYVVDVEPTNYVAAVDGVSYRRCGTATNRMSNDEIAKVKDLKKNKQNK